MTFRLDSESLFRYKYHRQLSGGMERRFSNFTNWTKFKYNSAASESYDKEPYRTFNGEPGVLQCKAVINNNASVLLKEKDTFNKTVTYNHSIFNRFHPHDTTEIDTSAWELIGRLQAVR